MEPPVSDPIANGTSPRPGRRARPGGRSAAPAVLVPGGDARTGEGGIGLPVAGAARQLHHGQLGRQHGARRPQPLHHRGVVVEDLVAKRRRPPGGRDPVLGCQQVLDAVGDAMQRAPVPARCDLLFGALGLPERPLAGNRHHRVVIASQPFQAVQENLGQLGRRNLPGLHQAPELADALENQTVRHDVSPPPGRARTPRTARHRSSA